MRAELTQAGGRAFLSLATDQSAYGIEAAFQSMARNRMFSLETRGAFELAAEIVAKVASDPAAQAALQMAIDAFNQRRQIPYTAREINCIT